jgi:hypothetical protein
MQITVALDGPKQRDLVFYQGDTLSLSVLVYAHDGDSVPAEVENARIVTDDYAEESFPVGSEFTVPYVCGRRVAYRLVADLFGVTYTLAYGHILQPGVHERVSTTPVEIPSGDIVYDGGTF